jgi:hypothetical protein
MMIAVAIMCAAAGSGPMVGIAATDEERAHVQILLNNYAIAHTECRGGIDNKTIEINCAKREQIAKELEALGCVFHQGRSSAIYRWRCRRGL